VWTLFELEQMLKMSPTSLQDSSILSQPPSKKLGTALLYAENFPMSSPMRLLIQKLSWMKHSRRLNTSLPRHNISTAFKLEELSINSHCFFWIICEQALLNDRDAQSPCMNESAAPWGNSRVHSPINFGGRN